MADKFAITAELQLVLDSNIEATVEQLKAKINRRPSILRLDLQQRDIRDIYKEVGALKKSFANHPLKIGLKHNPSDIRLIYREIGALKKSFANHPLKIRFDSSGIELAVKDILSNLNSVKTSLKAKPLDAKVGFDSSLLQAEIKKVYSEVNALKTSLQKPIDVRIQVVGEQELIKITNLISALRNKNVSIGLQLKKNTLDNFQKLSGSITSLNQAVAGFNIGQYDSIKTKTQEISKAITSLAKINGKKITFDLSVKDIKKVDVLDSGLKRVSESFNKASTSGRSFRAVIVGLADAVNQLKAGIGQINLSQFNTAAKSLKTLASPSAAKAQKTLTSSIKDSSSALYDLGVQSAITLKRFGAYTLVTAGFFRLSFALRNATNEFVEYDKELTKIKQVTNGSSRQTQDLSDQVGKLATTYGVSSSSILNTSQVLAQAGFSTKQTQEALEALTKTEVAPTFENIQNTVEGALAAMAQFNIKTSELDATLGSINAVSAAFAVESSDITTAIQKAGGAFASAGGSLNELIGAFTAVRATTRESADTVAVGIRTITTRLQRLSTASFLKDFGIDIRRTADEVRQFQDQFGRTPDFKEGDFVGPFEALKRISEATRNIGGADPRLAQIAEELAGFRQINKIIPLLRSFEVSQNAIQVAIGGTNSLTKDAEIAQESYANKLLKVREEFLLLIREFGQDEKIKELISQMLELAKVAIRVAKAFKDIVLPIALFAGLRGVSASKPYLQGFKDTFLNNATPKSRGGYIPGIGNKDSELIAAMPGEYVIKKSAAKQLGEGRLNLLNQGIIPKFADGGSVGGKALNVAGLGLAGISYFGGLENLSKLDDQSGNLLSSFGGLVLQTFALTGVIKSFREQAQAATIAKKAENSQTNGETPRTPALKRLFQEKLIKDSVDKERGFAKNISSTRDSTNSLNSTNIKKRLQKSNLEQRLNTGNQKFDTNIANTRSYIDKIKEDYKKSIFASIREEAVDPRSFAGKKGLKSQFKIKDEKTGVYRQFNTKKEAQDFAISRGADASILRNKEDKIPQLSKFLYSQKDKKANFNRDANSKILGLNNEIATNNKNLGPGVNSYRNYRIGELQGGREFARQQDITSRIAKQFNLQDPKLIPRVDPTVRSGMGAFGYSAQAVPNRDVKSFFGINGNQPPNKPPRNIRNGFGFFGGGPSGPNNPNGPNGPGRFGNIKSGFSKLQGSGLGIGIGAGLLGGLIGDVLQKSSAPTEDVKGSRAGFVTGGILSNAAGGAALGATVGSLVPVIGTAVGAALGGVAGAAKGAYTSLKDFDKQVSLVASNKALNSLGKSFESIKDGKTSSKTGAVNIVSNIKGLQQSLQSTSDKEARQEIFSGLENQKVNISNFVGDIAKISNSYKNFSQRIDSGTQRFIAGIIGIPFSEFKQNIEKDIETAIKFDNAIQRGIDSIEQFDNTVRSTIRFSEAFALASQKVNNFAADIEAFSFGSGGSTVLQNNLSTNLGNVQNGFNSGNLEKQLLSFTSQFGDIGGDLGKTASDVVRASNLLPDLLLNLKSGSPLDASGDITKKFSDSLDGLGVGSTVKNLLVSRIEDLLGTEGKDSDFFKNLSKDFPKAIETLLEGTKPVLDSVAKAYEISINKLNEFSSSLEKLRGFDRNILEGRVKVAQNQSSLIQSRGTFLGKNVDSQLLANEKNITGINTGGLSVDQLNQSLANRKANVSRLSNNLDNTENIQDRAQIQIAIENERGAIEKVTTALGYLANSTSELSILQSQLNKAQSERLTKRDFALDFASGSFQDKVRSRRVVSGANIVSRTGNINSVPEDIRKEIIGFLKTFSESDFGGQTGNDVLNKIANNATGLPAAFRNTGTPTGQEQSIQTQIEASLETQRKAQETINANLVNDRKLFFTQLNTDMGTFLTTLQSTLQEGQNRDLKNQFNTTQGKLGDVVQKRDLLSNIQNRFGENAIVNASAIQQLNQKLIATQNNKNESSNALNRAQSFIGDIKNNTGALSAKNIFGQGFTGNDIVFNGNKVNEADGRTIFNSILGNIPKTTKDQIAGSFDTTVTRDKNGYIDLSEMQSFLVSALKNVKDSSTKDLISLGRDKSELTNNVGGEGKFSAISKDVASKDGILLKSLNDFPKDTSLENLNREIGTLSGQLQALNAQISRNQPNPIRRNSGGIVPGFGSSDSIPALLTPGEFVLNRQAVKNVGLQTIRKVNSGAKRFQSGGLVQNTSIIDSESISRFNSAVSQLGIQVQNMRDAISKIPTEITMNGTHRLDVYINGAQAFTQMQSEFANLVRTEIKSSINKLIKSKMPQLGNFEG